jgi:hypothetical protein
MRYHLWIARTRPRGSVDTHSTDLNAPNIEVAINHSIEVVDRFLDGRPGVATLTSPYRGLIWSHRHNLPAPSWP